MKSRSRIIFIIAAAYLAAAGGNLHAQQTRNAIASEMEFTAKSDFGRAAVGGDVESGSFHRPQEASDKYGIFFKADGERQVGLFHLKGNFDFRQSFENGIQYSSTFDPLRDMPYVIADSTGGDWRKQYYSMWVDISAKICEKLSAGIGIDLNVGRGAKNIDPRPQAGMSKIGLEPTLSFNAGGAGVFSAGFTYYSYRENSNLILYDSSVPQKLYLLKGLGQYTYEIFSTTERERKYEGNSLGAVFGWLLTRNDVSVSAKASYLNGMESVFDIDYNKPHYRGKYYTDSWRGKFGFLYDPANWGLHVSADYNGSRGSGRELVQYFNSSSDVNAWVTDSEIPARYVSVNHDVDAEAGVALKRDGYETWRFAATAGWNSLDQTYKATSSEMKVISADFGARVSRQIRLAKAELDFAGSVDGSKNLDASLQCSRRETDDDNIPVGLVQEDFKILSSNVFGASLEMGCDWSLKHARTVGTRLTGFYQSASAALHRYGVSLGVSFKF